MAEKQVTTAPQDIVQKARGFWDKYSKKIIIAGSVVIVVVGGYLGYKYFFKLPKERTASELIFPAEKLFDKMAGNSRYSKDTLNLVLNGGNLEGTNVTGLLKIISKYGSTPSGNRARFMVGTCYLQLKEYDKAIKQLKEFDANGANQIQSKAYMLIGYAYSELKKTDDALSYFKKAASADKEDEGMATEALFIAGRYAKETGKTKEAIELFQQIKNDYPASARAQGGEVDKYLAVLGVVK
jgi:tetratricopeptide (TPR) repeat protein